MAVKRKPKPLFFVVLVGFLGIILLTIGGVFIYFSTPVDKNDENVIEVVIPQGTTTKKIGSILKEKDLIKSELYFSLYTRFFNHNSLKASTYKLTKSMSLADIVTSLEKGSTYDPDALVLTFKEGKRITDYVKLIANNTSYSEDEIIENAQWVAEQLGDTELDFPIVFDWEEFYCYQDYDMSINDLNEYFELFADEMKSRGYEAMLYSSKNFLCNFWYEHSDYPIWLAHYID